MVSFLTIGEEHKIIDISKVKIFFFQNLVILIFIQKIRLKRLHNIKAINLLNI